MHPKAVSKGWGGLSVKSEKRGIGSCVNESVMMLVLLILDTQLPSSFFSILLKSLPVLAFWISCIIPGQLPPCPARAPCAHFQEEALFSAGFGGKERRTEKTGMSLGCNAAAYQGCPQRQKDNLSHGWDQVRAEGWLEASHRSQVTPPPPQPLLTEPLERSKAIWSAQWGPPLTRRNYQ